MTTNVLRHADACWRPRWRPASRTVVHVSTDEVYGSIDEGSWTESEPLLPELALLGGQGRAATCSRRAYHRTHGLDVRVTRCSNNYGPYQFPEKLIPLFVTNLLDGEQVPLYGDGLNVRDWLHVDDHCRGIQLVLDRGAAGRDLQHRRRHRAHQPRADRAAAGRLRRGLGVVEHVRRPHGHDRRYSVDCDEDPRHSATSRARTSTTAWPRWCAGIGTIPGGGARSRNGRPDTGPAYQSIMERPRQSWKIGSTQ